MRLLEPRAIARILKEPRTMPFLVVMTASSAMITPGAAARMRNTFSVAISGLELKVSHWPAEAATSRPPKKSRRVHMTTRLEPHWVRLHCVIQFLVLALRHTFGRAAAESLAEAMTDRSSSVASASSEMSRRTGEWANSVEAL